MADSAHTPILTKAELFLLGWLAREDFSSVGECKGDALDRLVDLGFAKITPDAGRRGRDYDLASATEGGLAALTALKPTGGANG